MHETATEPSTYSPPAEVVPERIRINRPWSFGTCKRCLLPDTKPGDILVRLQGRGWWHDACYRVVNPRFYEGLADPPNPGF